MVVTDKTERFMDLCNRIFSMKEKFFETYSRIAESQINALKVRFDTVDYDNIVKSEKDLIYAKEGIIRNYLNVFEYACLLYNTNEIKQSLFDELFKYEILSMFDNNFGGVSNPSNRETHLQLRITYKKFKGEK